MPTLKLRGKIVFLALLAAAIPAVAMLVLVSQKEHTAVENVGAILRQLTDDIVEQNVDDIYDSCSIANDLLGRDLNTALALARRLAAEGGGIQFTGPPVAWNAVNQFTKAESPVLLPALRIGAQVIPPTTSFSRPVPIVDTVTEITGNTCTIFQRMNAAGDMLRVATTVPGTDGERGIGTFIPAVDSDGKPNPVVAKVLEGGTYDGSAYVVNAWYQTKYEPIRDAAGLVTGMLYVGVRQDRIESLERNLREMKIGERGYVMVFHSKGAARGESLIARDPQFRNKVMLGALDGQGRPWVREILERAASLPPGEPAQLMFELPPSPGAPPEPARVIFTPFPPWNWVICAVAFERDFLATKEDVERRLSELQFESLMGGIAALVLAAGVAWVVSRRISQPITDLTAVADHVAQGDLAEADRSIQGVAARLDSSIDRGDETCQLIGAFRTMIRQLDSLVGRVKDSSGSLVATASEITATAQQQERTVQDFGVSSNEIAAAVKEISATAQELLGTMDDVTVGAEQTTSMADSGRKGLGSMEDAMRRLANATRSISAKLSIINEKANNIGTVINTISDVADQTNLISLNAAIEAEKAGTAGQGFVVVAREIRRLADQTAQAALDIEEMVREMQSSVSSGVMEMDKFSEEVRAGVEQTGRISSQFADIISQVEALTPRFETVHEGMQSQSQGANQISEAMLKLAEGARNSADSVKEFKLAAEQLRDALHVLKQEVARFKTINA